jgi:hypothetical protein
LASAAGLRNKAFFIDTIVGRTKSEKEIDTIGSEEEMMILGNGILIRSRRRTPYFQGAGPQYPLEITIVIILSIPPYVQCVRRRKNRRTTQTR